MLPIGPPDSSLLPCPLPSLPVSDPDDWPLSEEFSRSKHIVPACYARVSPDVRLPSLPTDSSPRKERESVAKQGVDSIIQARIDYDRSASDSSGSQKVLWICLNRYVKRKLQVDPRKTGATLFLLHPNSTVKELWEPTIQRLLTSSAADQIDEIWAWDATQTGDSALLNEGKLQSLFHWHDTARDLLNFLIYYLPDKANSTTLPVHLPQISAEETARRLTNVGLPNSRHFVAVGHSFGGAISILAALEHPQLFQSIVLIDPAVLRPAWFDSKSVRLVPDYVARREYRSHALLAAARGAFGRRRIWKSREEASKQLLQSVFFQRWHPEVFQSYLTHGLYRPSTSNPSLRLKTSPLYETLMFVEVPTGTEEAWMRIPEIDERITLRWILPAEGQELGGVGPTMVTATRRSKNSTIARLARAGHLAPQENPEEVALLLEKFLKESRLGSVPSAAKL